MDSLLLAHPDSVVMIRYHASWPSENDPFYLVNAAESAARVDYYPVNSDPSYPYWYVPRLVFDGAPADSEIRYDDPRELYERLFAARASVVSPLEISLVPSYRKIKATLSASGPIPFADLKTRFVITESHIDFAAPNGVPVHDQTMRDMVPDAAGLSVALQQGGSESLTVAYVLDPAWAIENCRMVVFVQDDSTREVLQAAQCPVYDVLVDGFSLVEAEGNGDGKPGPGETINLIISLSNKGPQATGIFTRLETEDPDLDLLTSYVQYEDIPAWSAGANSSHPFVFKLAEGTQSHHVDFALSVTLNGGVDTVNVSFTAVMAIPQIGDVNEDGRIDIIDVVWVVNIILGIYQPTQGQEWAADTYRDGSIDILDAMKLVNIILYRRS